MEPYATSICGNLIALPLVCTHRPHSGEAEELGSESEEQRQVGGRREPGQCCPERWGPGALVSRF